MVAGMDHHETPQEPQRIPRHEKGPPERRGFVTDAAANLVGTVGATGALAVGKAIYDKATARKDPPPPSNADDILPE